MSERAREASAGNRLTFDNASCCDSSVAFSFASSCDRDAWARNTEISIRSSSSFAFADARSERSESTASPWVVKLKGKMNAVSLLTKLRYDTFEKQGSPSERDAALIDSKLNDFVGIKGRRALRTVDFREPRPHSLNRPVLAEETFELSFELGDPRLRRRQLTRDRDRVESSRLEPVELVVDLLVCGNELLLQVFDHLLELVDLSEEG